MGVVGSSAPRCLEHNVPEEKNDAAPNGKSLAITHLRVAGACCHGDPARLRLAPFRFVDEMSRAEGASCRARQGPNWGHMGGRLAPFSQQTEGLNEGAALCPTGGASVCGAREKENQKGPLPAFRRQEWDVDQAPLGQRWRTADIAPPLGQVSHWALRGTEAALPHSLSSPNNRSSSSTSFNGLYTRWMTVSHAASGLHWFG